MPVVIDKFTFYQWQLVPKWTRWTSTKWIGIGFNLHDLQADLLTNVISLAVGPLHVTGEYVGSGGHVVWRLFQNEVNSSITSL